jgi:hypothetical protein
MNVKVKVNELMDAEIFYIQMYNIPNLKPKVS